MFVNDPIMLLIMLLAGHALADFAFQNEFVAKAKNRNTQEGRYIWPWVLTSHSLIHGGVVAVITGIWWLAVAEAVAHWFIDFFKCDGKIEFGEDQALHIMCKVLIWVIVLFTVVVDV